MIQNNTLMKRTSVVYVLATVCCVLWGSAFPFIKMGYRSLGITSGDTSSQILFAGMRFALAGILTILIFSIRSRRILVLRKGSWFNIGKLGIMQTILQYVFFYIGLSNASSTKSSIIGGSTSFIAIVVACFFYKQEKFTKAKLIGSLLGFAGIIVINFNFESLTTSMTLTGEGFIFISTVASAISASMVKNYSEREDPVILSGYQFLCGGIVMTVIGFIMGGSLNFTDIGSVLIFIYLAALSAVAYSLWSILLKYNSVSKVSIFGFMIPIFGVILSALLLEEGKQVFNLQCFLSLLMVCTGIIIINKIHAAKPESST